MSSTHIVTDLGFGDAGKGTIVDALARRCSTPPLVVRHNGGAQAGHNVHTADGRHHTFSQFGAATFVPGSRTLLSQHMLLHPSALVAENEHLVSIGVKDALARLMIDARALVITPFQQAANRLREDARGAARHGSCGLGVGETVSDSLEYGSDVVRAADLTDPMTLRRKLALVRQWKRQQLERLCITGKFAHSLIDLQVLDDPSFVEKTVEHFVEIGRSLRIIDPSDADFQIRESEHVIFEGAQGVLLDEWHGFNPHTTWSTTTPANADALIRHAGRAGEVTRIGVLRAYATRHGQGPFPSQNAALTQQLRDSHNVDTGWQGRFRVGWFDTTLTRYALNVCPEISQLAVTCLDRLAEVPEWSICQEYDPALSLQVDPGTAAGRAYDFARCSPVLRKVPSDIESYVKEIEAVTNLPVAILSLGPTAESKRWRPQT